MSRFIVVLLLCGSTSRARTTAAAGSSAAAPWPQSGGSASRARASDAAGPTGLFNHSCWCVSVPSEDTAAAFAPVSSSADAVFIRVGFTPGTTLSNALLAVAAAPGGRAALLWNRTKLPGAISQPLAAPAFDAASDALYFLEESRNRILCLDAASGAERWTATSQNPIAVSPLARRGVVFFASSRTAFALNATTGAELWATPINDGVQWGAPSGLAVAAGVGVAGSDLLIVSGVAYALQALDCATGRSIWNSTNLCTGYKDCDCLAGAVVGDGMSAGLAFIVLSKGALVAVNASTGALSWSSDDLPTLRVSSWSPAVSRSGALLYAPLSTASGLAVVALNATSGAEVWRVIVCEGLLDLQATLSLAVDARGTIYGYCVDGSKTARKASAFGIDGESGARVFVFFVGSAIIDFAKVIDGPVLGPNRTLIVTSDAGFVCAVGCDAAGGSPVPAIPTFRPVASSASPSPGAPAAAAASDKIPTTTFLWIAGAGVALAAAGIAGSNWWSGRLRGGKAGLAGGAGGYGAMGRSGSLSGLLRGADAYAAVDDDMLVTDNALGEPTDAVDDPAAADDWAGNEVSTVGNEGLGGGAKISVGDFLSSEGGRVPTVDGDGGGAKISFGDAPLLSDRVPTGDAGLGDAEDLVGARWTRSAAGGKVVLL